jgi:hypothetical protein
MHRCITWFKASVVVFIGASLVATSASAQRTPINTRTVTAAVNTLNLVQITNSTTEFVEFVYVLEPRFQDKGFVTHAAEIVLNGPIGSTATVELKKNPFGVPGPTYLASFIDGRPNLEMKERDPVELLAEILGRIFPGVTLETLRKTYSEEELQRLAEAYAATNPGDPDKNGVRSFALLHKDACAPKITSYIARLVVDLRDVAPANRARAKVWGGFRMHPPTTMNAVLAQKGTPANGPLNGKQFVQLSSMPQSRPNIWFTNWKSRPGTRRKAKKFLTTRHPLYGTMLQVLVPKIKGAKKLTVEHLGENKDSIYSVCIAVGPKRQAINGFKNPKS